MSKYRVVIVGMGHRGRQHAAAFLANADRFDLTAVCDLDPGRLEEAKKELSTDVCLYGDAAEALDREEPDVLCFCTQPDVRLELVRLGIEHGVTAIAYEKPMALSLAEARQLVDLCNQAGVKSIVSHQHKYGSHWRKVREIVAGGEIGEVHTIHATSKGWLLNYGTHLIDYVMFLNGGSRGKWVVGHVHGRGRIHHADHPSPDYAMGQIEFENGVRAIIECGDLAPTLPGDNPFWYDAGAIVHGSEGYAQVIVGSGWRAVTKSSNGVISGPGCFDPAKDQPPYIADLADWLDDDAKVHPCDGETSYHGFELTLGIALSGLENRELDVPIPTNQDIIARMQAELPEA